MDTHFYLNNYPLDTFINKNKEGNNIPIVILNENICQGGKAFITNELE